MSVCSTLLSIPSMQIKEYYLCIRQYLSLLFGKRPCNDKIKILIIMIMII